MKKKVLWALSLILLLCLFVLGAGAEEKTIVAEGTCGAQGDNLTWTLDSEGTLTISGQGEMASYYVNAPAPWKQTANDVKNAVIEAGVTNIGVGAFRDSNSLTSVTIPEGVTSIGESAFEGCSALTSVNIPKGVISIGGTAFYGCSALTSVSIPEGVTRIGYYTFSGCSSLTSVAISAGVTSIDYRAFYGCSALTSVTLPDNITYIGSDAFPYNVRCNVRLGTDTAKALSKSGNNFWVGDLACRYEYDEDNLTGLRVVDCDPQVTSVAIPEGVTSIGESAFEDCSALTSVSIPKGVISIGSEAFSRCSALISVSIPEGVMSIDSYAFSGCSALTSVNIPESVTSIAYWAFSGCSALTSVSIPEGVKSIEDFAFIGCSALTSVSIPASMTSIGSVAFSSCSALTSVTLPENITSIGEGAFPSGIRCNVHLGTDTAKALSKSGYNFWVGDLACRYMYDKDNLTGLQVVDCDPQATVVVIPEGVTSIGDSAFSGCSALASVSIPAGVTSIGNSAFSGCSALASVSIPAGVTSIGSEAFQNCSALTSVGIPAGVTSIGESAFEDCSALISVSIPASVTSIGASTFWGCSALTSVSIPSGVASIGKSAFYECGSLTAMILPEGLTYLGESAFERCFSLESMNLPDSLVSIGIDALPYNLKCYAAYGTSKAEVILKSGHNFWDGNLAYQYERDGNKITELVRVVDCDPQAISVVVPSGVTSIDYAAFSGCSALTSVSIPEGVTSINESAFESCSELSYINLPESVTKIGEQAFLKCKKLQDIVLPSGLTVLERGAFYGTGITNIVIPDGVTEIGKYLFYYGRVKNVVLPNSVTIIDDGAFYACGMKTLVIPENVTTIGKEAIASVKVICYAKDGLTNFNSSSFQYRPETVYCWEFSPMESYANEAGCNVVLLDNLLDENGNIDWSKDTNAKTLTVQETCDMRVGTQRALDWSIFPGTNAAAEMTSSAPETVSIENGMLTAHKPGNATITVTVDGLTASCEVTAYEQVTELAFADAALSLPAKYTAALPLTCVPEGSNETLLWSSSNENVATVADGVITTKALGTTDITVMAKHSGLSATCTVTVTYPVTAVQFAAAEVKAVVGDKVQLTANVTARTKKYANELVTFTSSAPETALVDRHGLVTLLAPGSAIITATAMGNEKITATCELTVRGREDVQLVLPASLLVVEEEAFANIGAAAVILPEGCQRIESRAFADSCVTSIKIPASVSSIADDAFAGCAVTISAPEDSFAMNWAKEHGVPYIVE